MNYSDRELLAKTLQAEAGNQGIGGLLDVGSVIMNRVGQSGGSLRDVILKPAQFSAWNSVTGYAGGEQGQDMANMKPDARAYMVADNLLSGDYTDATGGATHYYNPSISNPDWGMKSGGNWAKRGDHVFGRADDQPKMNIATGGQPMMQPEQKPKGLLGGLFSDPDRRARLAMALEGMTLNPNKGFMASLQGGIEQRGLDKKEAAAEAKQLAQRNKTAEFLLANGREDLAGLVSQGMMSGSDAAKVMTTASKDTSTSAMKNYNEYQRILAEKGPEAAKQFLSTIKSGGVTVNTGDSSLYGKAPEGSVWAKDADGQHIMEETAPGSGKFRPSVLTLEGSNPEKRAAELAEKERKRIVNADSAFDAITLIDDIYNDPALPSVTGMIQGRLPALSQDGTDLVVKIDQLKGKAFLQAFETLKGGGQITEREGLAATKAIARLERKQGPEAYRESLKALRSVVERVRKRALGQEVPEYSDEEFEAIIGNLPAIPESSSVSPQKTKTGVTYKVIGGSGG